MNEEILYGKGFFMLLDEEKGPAVYREGFFGKPLGIEKPKTPIFQAKMILSFYEALYLKKNKQMKVLDLSGNEMNSEQIEAEAKNYIEDFEIKYPVYEDLRNRGYIPKPGFKYGVTFMVYRYGPGIDHAPFLVQVMKKGEKLEVIEIIRAGRLSHSVRKRLVLAIVDPDTKEISYYSFKWFE